MIRSGAALPNRCFVTGLKTDKSVEAREVWQPAWVYLLLLPGLFPYFVASPFLSRVVTLRVPLEAGRYARHLRNVNIGFAMILIGVSLTIAGVGIDRLPLGFTLLLPIGIALTVFGFFLSSHSPVTLNIVSLDGDLLTLRHVHADCLAEVPAIHITDAEQPTR